MQVRNDVTSKACVDCLAVCLFVASYTMICFTQNAVSIYKIVVIHCWPSLLRRGLWRWRVVVRFTVGWYGIDLSMSILNSLLRRGNVAKRIRVGSWGCWLQTKGFGWRLPGGPCLVFINRSRSDLGLSVSVLFMRRKTTGSCWLHSAVVSAFCMSKMRSVLPRAGLWTLLQVWGCARL